MTSTLSQFNYQIHQNANSKNLWVFAHGLMGYGQNWQRTVNLLQVTALTFDQRGHGRSFKPEQGYAPEDFAEDLKMILESLNFSKVILVGHSMGARNSMVFAAKYPEFLKALVLEDMGPDKKPESPAYYEKLFSLLPNHFSSRAEAKAFLIGEFNNQAIKLGQPPSIGAYFYSNIVELEGGTVDFRFSRKAMLEIVRQGHQRDYWSDFESIKTPTLIVRGQNSTEFSKQTFEKMLSKNPHCQGLEIPNAGHWVHADQPQLFAQGLKEFIELDPVYHLR